MSEAYEKLKKTLRTIFEMDKADLDFGIYRIMNQRREEIEQFLKNNLLSQVSDAFEGFATGKRAELKKELEGAIELAKKYNPGSDPEETEPVKELRAKIASSVDITAVENEVYSHLHTFFSRYYDKGDFISQRRYKSDAYAIPYGGEEVKLYWANQDQYYIKSSEHLRDYAFTLQQNDDKKKVHFHLVEADTEKDNVKARNGEERHFVLDSDNPLTIVDGELIIRFQYTHKVKEKQEKLNSDAVETIIGQKGFDEWLSMLQQKPPATGKNQNRTYLEKHLNDYTARNTFDYFIHKDLGGFLRRELDFYIKNEVIHLDDIDDTILKVTKQHLCKIKVIRTIGHKLIRMLAQLEDFQKKLWLKKKFVVETNYCITLDRIPVELYEEIIACEAQCIEWKSLFAIDALEGYSTPLTVNFLKANRFIVLDTAFFSNKFKDKLLAKIKNIDTNTDGLLIHSENFQALRLIEQRYTEQVKCIYIDPPYNTAASEILYKNSYKHSSWCSLMQDRLAASKKLLNEKGILEAAIDDMEFSKLENIIKQTYGDENFITNIAIMHNPKGRDQRHIADCHEYTIIAAKNIKKATTGKLKLSEDALAAKYPKGVGNNRHRELPLRRTGSGAQREDRPSMYFPFIHSKDGTELFVIPEDEYKNIYDGSNFNDKYVEELSKKYENQGYDFILPIRQDGSFGRWRWGYNSCNKRVKKGVLFVKEKSKKTVCQIDEIDDMFLPKSLWYGERYDASSKGTNLLKGILGPNEFNYPKSLHAVEDLITIGSNNQDYVLDFFAGSGTTGHALINLNRLHNANRKYILIEMGQHFDNVLRRRLEKIVYSNDYKNKKPVDRKGLSHCFKYIRLESYEDALNNLVLKGRTKLQQILLNKQTELLEDYMLGYWLDVETRGSCSLLNTEQFEDPFNYKLNIATDSVGVTKSTCVDLVETFNYLLGLTVKHIGIEHGFKVIYGTNPKDESVLVVWRNTKVQNNVVLEKFFEQPRYNPKSTEYIHIYVNGDHTLDDPCFKVKMIEIEFKRLMFDVQDV